MINNKVKKMIYKQVSVHKLAKAFDPYYISNRFKKVIIKLLEGEQNKKNI